MLDWTLIPNGYYRHNHAALWSFGQIKVQNFVKGHSQKIQICLKPIENRIFLLQKVIWPATLLGWPYMVTCYYPKIQVIYWYFGDLNNQDYFILSFKSYMITKHGKMIAFDELLWPRDSSDLLIFYLRDELYCPIKVQNYSMWHSQKNFETNWKHYIFTSKSLMIIQFFRMDTYYEFASPTWSCELLIFW